VGVADQNLGTKIVDHTAIITPLTTGSAGSTAAPSNPTMQLYCQMICT